MWRKILTLIPSIICFASCGFSGVNESLEKDEIITNSGVFVNYSMGDSMELFKGYWSKDSIVAGNWEVLGRNGEKIVELKIIDNETGMLALQVSNTNGVKVYALKISEGVVVEEYDLQALKEESRINGRVLFENNCKVCHLKYKRLIGPSLNDIVSKYSKRRFLEEVQSLHQSELRLTRDSVFMRSIYKYGQEQDVMP